MRRVIYISGTRADFGLMRGTLRAMAADPRLDLGVLVTGMHLDETHGQTWRDIGAAGLKIVAKVAVDTVTRTRASMSSSLGEMVIGMTRVLEAAPPDAVIVLGDRAEMLAAAIVCLHLGIPLFHIHGGERSGTVDEPVRHAISRMATWHLVATAGSRERLVRMGEREDSVIVTGAPGIDGLHGLASVSAAELLDKLGLDPGRPFVLALFHPVVQQAEQAREQSLALLAALDATGLQIIWLAPNSDAGSADIADSVQASLQGRAGSAFIVHLSREDFATAMRHCTVMAGNSSAGIIEAASFGTPVVNVGDRQRLRERNANVRDCGTRREEIAQALGAAIAAGRCTPQNAYGDGHAGARILEAVCSAPIDASRLSKVNTY